MPKITVDSDVYRWLQSQARPFNDTPNSVLRRVAGLGGPTDVVEGGGREQEMTTGPEGRRIKKTPQGAYRAPVAKLLAANGGEMRRVKALHELEQLLSDELTEDDKAEIKSGTPRWKKTAEWEVRYMRAEGLIKPVHETEWGVWALTPKGWEFALSLEARRDRQYGQDSETTI